MRNALYRQTEFNSIFEIGHYALSVLCRAWNILWKWPCKRNLEYEKKRFKLKPTKPKIGFIMQVPTIWNKIQPVFELASNRTDVEVIGIVVPDVETVDTDDKKNIYGDEYSYFHGLYDNLVDYVNKDGNLLDIYDYKFDYLFYQRPYEELLPLGLRAANLIGFTKVCYIPYGAKGADSSEEFGRSCVDFFRSVYFNFEPFPHLIDGFANDVRYKDLIEDELLKCVFEGYPIFEKALYKTRLNKDGCILWTPRWTCSEILGGSHFFNYKDDINFLKKKYPNERIIIRPHPLMFRNFMVKGLMSHEEYIDYLNEVEKAGIKFDENKDVLETLKETKLLITDYSMIIPSFFIANIPIVYCNADNIDLNEPYRKMINANYKVDSSSELLEVVQALLCEGDKKQDMRKKRIDEFLRMYEFSSEKIINTIVEDFRCTL